MLKINPDCSRFPFHIGMSLINNGIHFSSINSCRCQFRMGAGSNHKSCIQGTIKKFFGHFLIFQLILLFSKVLPPTPPGLLEAVPMSPYPMVYSVLLIKHLNDDLFFVPCVLIPAAFPEQSFLLHQLFFYVTYILVFQKVLYFS